MYMYVRGFVSNTIVVRTKTSPGGGGRVFREAGLNGVDRFGFPLSTPIQINFATALATSLVNLLGAVRGDVPEGKSW